MVGGKGNSVEDEIRDLELVHWVDEEHSLRGIARNSGVPMEREYKTFQDLYNAILENGPLVGTSSIVDVSFLAVSGEFDGQIMAVRQSGRNVRRFLVREDLFEDQYGSFQNCLDHIRSNNAVDCELEIKHLNDMAEKLEVSPSEIDRSRSYSRLEVDIIAAVQLLEIMDQHLADDTTKFHSFELGYRGGRGISDQLLRWIA